MKKDITFVIIGIIITIIIPIACIIIGIKTIKDIVLVCFATLALDLLCYLAHKIINKGDRK